MVKLLLPQGHLQAGVLALLCRAGITFVFKDPRDYRPLCSDGRIEVKVVRPQLIPRLLGQGKHHFGFCGTDLLVENEAAGVMGFVACVDTGLNPVNLVLATHGMTGQILQQLPCPLIVATESPFTAQKWASERGIVAQPLYTWGCTEALVPDDAHVVLDVTETGNTLRKNGLVVLETVLRSTTQLVAAEQAATEQSWFVDLVKSAVLEQQA